MSNDKLTVAEEREVAEFRETCKNFIARAKADPEFARSAIQEIKGFKE